MPVEMLDRAYNLYRATFRVIHEMLATATSEGGEDWGKPGTP